MVRQTGNAARSEIAARPLRKTAANKPLMVSKPGMLECYNE